MRLPRSETSRSLRLRQGIILLGGWGLAVVGVRQVNPNLDTSGLYLAGAGAGATIGMLLMGAFDREDLPSSPRAPAAP